MKRLLWFVSFFALTAPIAAQNEIPNWNMETWDSTLVRLPHQWQMRLGNISRVTGHGGLYACQLVNAPAKNNPGVVLYGFTNNGQTFSGGIPFTERPDSISAYFKYHIVIGDTAFMLVSLKKQGTPLCFQWIPIAANGAASTSFTQVTKKITYSDTNSTHMPDSLIVGVICTNPNNNGVWPVGDTLIVDDISFPGATTAIPNGTFEAWDSLMSYSLRGWYGTSGNDVSDTVFSIARTTDKFEGAYAALIQSKVSATDTVVGMAATTPLGDSMQNVPSFKVSQRYATFSFAYKFLPQNGDTMNVAALLYKNHSQIGSCGYSSGATDAVWKQVSVPINYYDPANVIVPDSATIFLDACMSNQPKGNSSLYIDNLAFLTTAVLRIPVASSLKVNKFTAELRDRGRQLALTFQLGASGRVAVRLVDMAGREVAELVNQTMAKGAYTATFDASRLSQGMYLVQEKTSGSVETRKIMVAR